MLTGVCRALTTTWYLKTAQSTWALERQALRLNRAISLGAVGGNDDQNSEPRFGINRTSGRMKWIFLAGLAVATLIVAALLKSNRNRVRLAAFGLGLLPFMEVHFHLFAAPIAWPQWQGIVKGTEISVSDALAFAVLISSAKAKSPTALRIAFAGVVLAYAISTLASGTHMESLFFGWEIVRGLLVYLALLRATAADHEVPIYVLKGLIAGLVIQAAVVISEYATGAVQAGGWFGHQNLLGFTTHFVAYSAFAAFLAGYFRKTMLLALFASIIIAFTGASRATIGLMLAGICATTFFSIWHHRTGRKMAVIGVALVAIVMVSPLLYSAVQRRSVEQREDSSQERELMKSAASMIVSDNPLGVGANRYVVVANVGGYAERAGVPWDFANRSAPVHNSYYLVTAEMGWLGLGALIGLLVAGLSVAINTLRRMPPGLSGELAAGTASAMLMVAIHSNYEWIFFIHSSLYFLALTLGVVGGLNARVRKRARVAPRQTNPPSPLERNPALGSAAT